MSKIFYPFCAEEIARHKFQTGVSLCVCCSSH